MKIINLFDGEVLFGVSHRGDGNMRFFDGDEAETIKNQEKFARRVGVEKVARINTRYENRDDFTEYKIVAADNFDKFDTNQPEDDIEISDGIVTKEKNLGIILPLADCLGMVVYCPKKKILGLLHAGRHNIEQFGPRKFIEKMCSEFGCKTKDLKVYFSPCARSNYPLHKFNNMSIQDTVKMQLKEVGVLPENITENLDDTTTSEEYPSNSCGDRKLRFAILVAIIE